jgi:hypothetical protein
MARKAIPKTTGQGNQKPPLEGDYIPPNQPLNFGKLNLDRTAVYVEKLKSMSEREAMDFLNNGIKIKLMLLNDQILKQLEILDGSEDPRVRLVAISTIEKLTACASMITENKIKLDKSLGLQLPGNIIPPETAPIGEMSEDDFMSQFTKPKPVTDGGLALPPVLGD